MAEKKIPKIILFLNVTNEKWISSIQSWKKHIFLVTYYLNFPQPPESVNKMIIIFIDVSISVYFFLISKNIYIYL